MKKFNLEHLEPTDIINIGGTIYNDDGGTAFVCDADTANVEKLILKELLARINPSYKIVSSYDIDMLDHPKGDPASPDSCVFCTNLPYDEYEKIFKIATDSKLILPWVWLSTAIGYDSYGNKFEVDFDKVPNMLICGTDENGKTALLRNIRSQYCTDDWAGHCKFIIADAGKSESSEIEKGLLKHILFGNRSLRNPNDIREEIHHLVEEMDARLIKLQQLCKKSIHEYNKEDMPFLFLVVDGYDSLANDTMMDIIRLAQKGRSAGIHCILCSERFGGGIIPGSILKVNFPLRVAFRMGSGVESENLIGTRDAVNLQPMEIIVSEEGRKAVKLFVCE